ncbi:rhodanese-like domain-containing protein [Geoalkalibacter halelectricus]|uniref:Rhodanese domain-containing protein n=1 Tax=Geoalkalibacter halelectricus TaxID=2847045 RepID=A0ABY5ZHZ1_9BACT|nr:rhodanese-like domain-containing protein [Geoalkalibacter halelectricus]MDO3379360.1 hypothetical protein [Geoalkalibacter halelectricus]UWZ78762.1 hypothetical protein L9S41_13890 [Geoalkalibacter halelectricus]
MRLKAFTFLAVLIALVVAGCTTVYPDTDGVARMSLEQLHGRLGESDLVIIDARTPGEWRRAEVKIPGAVREDPRQISWADRYDKNDTLVLYCA